MASTSTRASERNTDWRIVRISDIDTETGLVVGRDQYETPIQINTSNKPVLLQIPVLEELWVVRRRGNDWLLESRYDPDEVEAPLWSLKPGDARIDAPGRILVSSGRPAANNTYGQATYGSNTFFSESDIALKGNTSVEGNLTATGRTNLTPWLIDIDVFMSPVSNVNWSDITADANAIHNGYSLSTGSQFAEINFDLLLGAGMWDFELMHYRNSDRGNYHVYLDATGIVVISGYSISPLYNQRFTWKDNVVTETKRYRLKFAMESKSGLSSGYVGSIQHVQLRRTA